MRSFAEAVTLPIVALLSIVFGLQTDVAIRSGGFPAMIAAGMKTGTLHDAPVPSRKQPPTMGNHREPPLWLSAIFIQGAPGVTKEALIRQ